VLKNWDTNLLQSEKKTLWSFLGLYLVFTLILLFVLGLIYYNFQKDLMLQEKRLLLSEYANEQIIKLKKLHANFENEREYPRDTRFESGIYDSSGKEIFSTMKILHVSLDEVIYLKDNKIYFIKEPESYYLGTKYLVLQVSGDDIWFQETFKTIFFYASLFFIVMIVLGYFLMRLFLKPMRDAIKLLDRFIKDTTHELNTPINAILSNIEMIELEKLDENLQKKIKRIDIGARTVSNLYQDLTYLILSHKIISQDVSVSLEELIKERVEYFTLFADSRKISFEVNIKEDKILYIDRKKMAKLIDNVLSNAIKYNKIKGKIFITLCEDSLEIKDTGRGVPVHMLGEIFKRYSRADESVGGFGIGLSIVSVIAKEYGLNVIIDSVHGEWTKVSIRW
jgi:two-component system OmpR family sensor kinase